MTAEEAPGTLAIVVVGDHEEQIARVERMLSRRLGGDYQIVAARSPDAALESMRAIRARSGDVALILAAHDMAEMSGTRMLAQCDELFPRAKRALLVGFNELAEGREEILQAAAVGEMDTYVIKPLRDLDEAFYRDIAQLLEEWDRFNRPQVEGLRIVGDAWDPLVARLRDALQRSNVPAGFYQHDTDEGRALLAQAGVLGPLPVVISAEGQALARPTNAEVAELLMVNVDPTGIDFDVAIIGAGPGGLAAAVYAASEGLDALVIDSEALGGQASTSTAIRNYLGFPRGVSGTELASRAYWQAWFFGARFLIGREVRSMRADGDLRVVTVEGDLEVRARAVVLAAGVTYRRLEVESVESFVGRGVFYGAPVSEAPAMTAEQCVVVGGGNSSAQSALYLAEFASRVILVVRRPELDEMSHYLVRDIDAHPSIEVRRNTVVEQATGDNRLRSVTLHDRVSDAREDVPATGMFVLIGAEPHTDWLPTEIERDDRGYIKTGADIGRTIDGDRYPFRLETSMPGVFAVGDIRSGSLKRVAAAVGEGSSAIRHVHDYLALAREKNP